MTNAEKQAEALGRARDGTSLSNYSVIIRGFRARGIKEEDIQPRENIFTFQAWKALGRFVRKGEHGVRVCTYVPMELKDGKDEKTGEDKIVHRSAPRMTTVFHVSQTEKLEPIKME